MACMKVLMSASSYETDQYSTNSKLCSLVSLQTQQTLCYLINTSMRCNACFKTITRANRYYCCNKLAQICLDCSFKKCLACRTKHQPIFEHKTSIKKCGACKDYLSTFDQPFQETKCKIDLCVGCVSACYRRYRKVVSDLQQDEGVAPELGVDLPCGCEYNPQEITGFLSKYCYDCAKVAKAPCYQLRNQRQIMKQCYSKVKLRASFNFSTPKQKQALRDIEAVLLKCSSCGEIIEKLGSEVDHICLCSSCLRETTLQESKYQQQAKSAKKNRQEELSEPNGSPPRQAPQNKAKDLLDPSEEKVKKQNQKYIPREKEKQLKEHSPKADVPGKSADDNPEKVPAMQQEKNGELANKEVKAEGEQKPNMTGALPSPNLLTDNFIKHVKAAEAEQQNKPSQNNHIEQKNTQISQLQLQKHNIILDAEDSTDASKGIKRESLLSQPKLQPYELKINLATEECAPCNHCGVLILSIHLLLIIEEEGGLLKVEDNYEKLKLNSKSFCKSCYCQRRMKQVAKPKKAVVERVSRSVPKKEEFKSTQIQSTNIFAKFEGKMKGSRLQENNVGEDTLGLLRQKLGGDPQVCSGCKKRGKLTGGLCRFCIVLKRGIGIIDNRCPGCRQISSGMGLCKVCLAESL